MSKSYASLRVVPNLDTPLPPVPPCDYTSEVHRRIMSSRPIFSDVGLPTSSMLLTSLCDAWHDVGDRAARILYKMQHLPTKQKSVEHG